MATSKVKRLMRKQKSNFAACITDRWLLSPKYNKHLEIEEQATNSMGKNFKYGERALTEIIETRL